MWKIHRYYLKETLLGAVLVFTILFGIVMISTVPRGLDKATGFGLLDALKITFLWTIDTIPHLLPVSPLFAIVLTYARASQEREITAIRAAGISPRVAMVPAVLVGLLFSLLTSVTLNYIVPWAHYEKFRVVPETVKTALIHTGMLEDKLEFSGVMMTWAKLNSEGRWEDVEIVFDRSRLEQGALAGEGLVTAEEAWLETSKDRNELSLVLKGARSWGGENKVAIGEPRIAVDLRSIARRWGRPEDEKDLSTDQLLSEVYRGVRTDALRAHYIAHRRSCLATLPSLFAPIGFVIGILSRARGRMTALVFALVPVLLAYACDVVAENLLRPTGIAWIGWLPAAMLTALGLPFCWQYWRF